jgi:subtilisin family serine protease
VIPVMDLSYDLAEQPFYPNRHIAGGDLTNVVTVAASDATGNPLIGANFGMAELDLFAPGVDIESTYPHDAYAIGSGSYLAASIVTGVAAFIKSYFPRMAPAEMRVLLMDSVTPRNEAEVEKQYYQNGKIATDLFLFEELSISGGILNGAKALEVMIND